MCIFAKMTRLKRTRSSIKGFFSLEGIDRINIISLLFALLGFMILLSGILFIHPNRGLGILADSYPGWLGLFADSILLYWINRVIKKEEETKLMEQFGSESNAFFARCCQKNEKEGMAYQWQIE